MSWRTIIICIGATPFRIFVFFPCDLSKKKNYLVQLPQNEKEIRGCLVGEVKFFGCHIGSVGRMSGEVFEY